MSVVYVLIGSGGAGREALMFSLISTRINGWVRNREAGDLRRYRAHYNVTVMLLLEPVRACLFQQGLQGLGSLSQFPHPVLVVLVFSYLPKRRLPTFVLGRSHHRLLWWKLSNINVKYIWSSALRLHFTKKNYLSGVPKSFQHHIPVQYRPSVDQDHLMLSCPLIHWGHSKMTAILERLKYFEWELLLFLFEFLEIRP